MSKSKGTRAERELFHLFWQNGFNSLRTAGSGSTSMPAPDLIAAKDGRILVIECKSGAGNNRYIKKEQIEELIAFAKTFDGEPWIAARFDRIGWFFVKAENLEQTKGENFVVNLETAKTSGFKFEDLIKSQ